MVNVHTALKAARTDAHKGDAVPVGLVHVGLYLEYEGRKIGAVRADKPCRGHARQRLGRKAQEIGKERLYPEVCQRRAEEYRRQLAGIHLRLIKLVGGTVQQLNIIAQHGVQRRGQQLVQVRVAQVRLYLRSLLGAGFSHRLKGQYLFFIAHIHALELPAAADGPVHGVCLDAQHLLYFLQKVEGVCAPRGPSYSQR